MIARTTTCWVAGAACKHTCLVAWDTLYCRAEPVEMHDHTWFVDQQDVAAGRCWRHEAAGCCAGLHPHLGDDWHACRKWL